MPTFTTISAGSVSAISLAAGSTLKLSGAGTAQLTPPGVPGTDNAQRTVSGELSFGPYPIACTVLASAAPNSNGLRHYTIGATDAVPPGGAQSGAGPLSADSLQAMVSGAGNAVPPQISTALLSSQAMYRLRSLPNTTGSSTLMTSSMKLEVEAPFDAVGLVALNCMATPLNSFKAVVAATETFSQATQATRYQPVVGGTTYNALRTASDLYGWDLVTWSGAGSATIPAGTGGTAAARLAAPGVLVSDMMPIIDVPRADGGSYPILMYRATCDPTGGNNWPFLPVTNESTTVTGRKYDVGQSYNDAVGTLGNTLSAALSAQHWAYPIVRHSRGVASVAVVGDSHAEQSGILSPSSIDQASNYVLRACHDLSSRKRPVVSQNLGLSGHTSDTYCKHAKAVLAAVAPTIAFLHVFSVNDGAPTNLTVRTQLQQGLDLMRWCQARNIYPILCTPLLDQRAGNNTAANHAARVWLRDRLLDFVGVAGVTVCDHSAMFELVGGVDNYKAGYMFSDQYHPSVDAIEYVMRVAARAALTEALGRLGY